MLTRQTRSSGLSLAGFALLTTTVAEALGLRHQALRRLDSAQTSSSQRSSRLSTPAAAWPRGGSNSGGAPQNESGKRSGSSRSFATPADLFFQKHGVLPKPPLIHRTLRVPETDDGDTQGSNNIFVIGDVHGCFEELIQLHEKAVKENNGGQPFQWVILVGDLCNKGPDSVKVIRHVRTTQRWLTVRGNHDDAALMAALGEAERRGKRKYQWIVAPERPLSDEDVQWMADLPYTIRIPSGLRGSKSDNDADTIIVHAGLVPGVPLEDQSIVSMVSLRTVEAKSSEDVAWQVPKDKVDSYGNRAEVPWASVWQGPEHVVFGHDARRGLQSHRMALGLDTGAVYGKKLTGVILPSRTLVTVPAVSEHCPVGHSGKAD